jgi:hypothetical protein
MAEVDPALLPPRAEAWLIISAAFAQRSVVTLHHVADFIRLREAIR